VYENLQQTIVDTKAHASGVSSGCGDTEPSSKTLLTSASVKIGAFNGPRLEAEAPYLTGCLGARAPSHMDLRAKHPLQYAYLDRSALRSFIPRLLCQEAPCGGRHARVILACYFLPKMGEAHFLARQISFGIA
jgi:hypothetical protein